MTGARKLTVHVVDDDEAIRDSLRIWLEIEGFNVETFPSGDAYLSIVHDGDGAVLLLDLTLPGRSGQEVLDELAHRPESPAVIIITSQDDDKVRNRVLRAGARAVLSKPLDHAELLDQILRNRPHTPHT